MSQLDFLRDLDCNHHEVHLLCTHHLHHDWNRLASAFGLGR